MVHRDCLMRMTLHRRNDILPIATNGEDIGQTMPRERAAAQQSEPKAAIDIISSSLEDSKAEDVVQLEISGKSSLADFMVVASGRSHRHVGAIADQVLRDLKASGLGSAKVEGMPHCDWVLVDAGDVILHIFRPEVREFYNIEKMWSTGQPDHVQFVG